MHHEPEQLLSQTALFQASPRGVLKLSREGDSITSQGRLLQSLIVKHPLHPHSSALPLTPAASQPSCALLTELPPPTPRPTEGEEGRTPGSPQPPGVLRPGHSPPPAALRLPSTFLLQRDPIRAPPREPWADAAAAASPGPEATAGRGRAWHAERGAGFPDPGREGSGQQGSPASSCLSLAGLQAASRCRSGGALPGGVVGAVLAGGLRVAVGGSVSSPALPEHSAAAGPRTPASWRSGQVCRWKGVRGLVTHRSAQNCPKPGLELKSMARERLNTVHIFPLILLPRCLR